ncbi:hypothetical protein [Desulfohalovibrio reitneri]|uniref:hypothetical protein n=1 Tax=Desulfohalovibrio reitneri TaxID=1307759 RepID=UPI000555410E|nr:hypothetical protein [Desulfohalovibrio reitneri]
MLLRWIPWNFIIRKAAKHHGIIDPASVMAKVRSFSQPSEVKEPIELLRAGIIFQARGLVNTRAIQFNLDWVWPYWVERQFNPEDPSFIPRAYSFTHINLTQRDWSAVGLPDVPLYPIVDPRGLVTPLYDGWSLDFWVLGDDGRRLLPSKLDEVEQTLGMEDASVRTDCVDSGMRVSSTARQVMDGGKPRLLVDLLGESEVDGWLAVTLRPYNPEGVRFIEKVECGAGRDSWLVDGEEEIHFGKVPDKMLVSSFDEGDVLHKVDHKAEGTSGTCRVGMVSAAALFRLKAGKPREMRLKISLESDLKEHYPEARPRGETWSGILEETAGLDIPDERVKYVYDSAVRTLVMLSAHEIVPGPYNYRRFWFRDAALMLNAVLALGLGGRAERILSMFPEQQRRDGYFRSQEGEWDSNGQVLWIYDRFQRLTGRGLDEKTRKAVRKGAEWFRSKRITNRPGNPENGLLPAGFSAEHLGPNDYYYWDDFWGVAGLRCAARLLEGHAGEDEIRSWRDLADEFEETIWNSVKQSPGFRRRGGIPASPYRRMDAGAIGSMVADYPLQLTDTEHEAMNVTLEYLHAKCFHKGGFFQDMVHSGMNAYLTFAIGQSFLRAGDRRVDDIVQDMARLASPTGHWPEAIHPFSGGGCMGDGQHGWAAAEWIMLIRNLFVREEWEKLVLGAGIQPSWMKSGEPIAFGPTLTPHGRVAVRVDHGDGGPVFHVDAVWREKAPEMIIAVPGYKRIKVDPSVESYVLEPEK